MNVLLLTVGPPRSGKSTWAQSQIHPIVNPDSIRLALHGFAFVREAEPYVWAIAKTMVNALFLAGHEAVILDATNMTRQRRDEWKSKHWVRHLEIFEVDEDTCYKRALDSERPELIDVIKRMVATYEKPTDEELDEGEAMTFKDAGLPWEK